MKAACLVGVLVLAKVLVLAAVGQPWSPWAPLAYFWQDAAFVLGFAVVELMLQRLPWAAWGLYAMGVVYTAVNVPVACTLATPLTWPMLHAASGTLAESVAHHVTPVNILRVAVVFGAGAALPLALRRHWGRLSPRWRIVAPLLLLGLALPGPWAARQVQTLGLHRNAVVALVATALPRVTPADADADWAASPYGSPQAESLTRYRGRAAGRNVVIVHLESTAARYLRPYGAAEDPMPNLTALTRQGILWENAYTAYPETIKSFFAVHCAAYPALDTEPAAYEHYPSPALAEILAAAGYRTALFHSGRFGYLGMESVLRGRGWEVLEDAGSIGGDRESSFGIDEPSAVRRLLAWIDGVQPGDRFLVTYLPIAGHHPYVAPGQRPFPADEEIDRYRNALHYADEALGQLVTGLQERGRLDDTLLIIFGDHGEAFGQHAGNYGHTQFLYEENVRVPLVMVMPGLLDGPLCVSRVASLVDVAPTVLDLLGRPAAETYQGQSLLEGRTRMALFCTEYAQGLVGLRDGRWKAIHDLDSGRTQLFDLEADPGEQDDVAGKYPERVAVYRDHLLGWAAGQKYKVCRRPP